MAVKWKGGRNMHTLQMKVDDQVKDLRARATEALEKTVAEGGSMTQDFLEDAVTPTGRRREAESGGFPGRHDTGNMVGSVSYEIRNPRAKQVHGVFGWWGENFEAYFRDQDLGEGNIPAARALPQAYLRAREAFRARMKAIVKGQRPG